VLFSIVLPQEVNAATITARPNVLSAFVDGDEFECIAYLIDDNNYLRLRDIALLVNGTEKQFEVDYDEKSKVITLTSGKVYTVIGYGSVGVGVAVKAANPTKNKIFLDGKELNLTAYLINNNNYLKLRDIGRALDFFVDWDGANNAIIIDTSRGYTPERIEFEYLLFSPAVADRPANDMEDATLIHIFETFLYKNAKDVLDGWLLSGSGLDLDENSILDIETENTGRTLGTIGGAPPIVYEIKNIKNIAAVKANLETVFSLRLLENTIYPQYFESEYALFIEKNGKLYYSAAIGGEDSRIVDFTRARVTNKNAHTFEIEVPMTTPSNQEGEWFVFKAEQQNSNWVLDSFYYFESKRQIRTPLLSIKFL
jgi:hypothetical protein